MQKLMEQKNIQLRQVSLEELKKYASGNTHHRIDRRGMYALDPQNTSIAYIPLTQGQIAKIDANIVEECATHNWYARWQGSINSYYAIRRNRCDTIIQLHRFVYEHVNGSIDYGMQIDHINGDTLDNRFRNLRQVSNRENHTNCYYHRQGKLVGATYNRVCGNWQAYIKQNNVQYHIGYFPSETIAHEAYCYVLEQIEGGMSPRDAILLYQLCADATESDGDR